MTRVIHGLDEITRSRILMIAAGYEDGNNADHLRRDPMFRRMRWRGLLKATLQVKLTAIAYNLKRTSTILKTLNA